MSGEQHRTAKHSNITMHSLSGQQKWLEPSRRHSSPHINLWICDPSTVVL